MELREEIKICNNLLSIKIKSVFQKPHHKEKSRSKEFHCLIKYLRNNTNFIPTQKKKKEEETFPSWFFEDSNNFILKKMSDKDSTRTKFTDYHSWI